MAVDFLPKKYFFVRITLSGLIRISKMRYRWKDLIFVDVAPYQLTYGYRKEHMIVQYGTKTIKTVIIGLDKRL